MNLCNGYAFHNYHHVVKTVVASGTGESRDVVYLYCSQCADIIEISGESETVAEQHFHINTPNADL